KPVPVDIRLVAATDLDLDGQIADGDFRGALFARLSEITFHLPTLADRREDILDLLAVFAPAARTRLHPKLVEALLLYSWPFNVRELRKVGAELEIRGKDKDSWTLNLVEHRLRTDYGDAPEDEVSEPSTSPSGPPTLEELRLLLETHQGNVSAISRHTGRSRRQVKRWIEDAGFQTDDFRADDFSGETT
ncbi:MAG: sigma 54-interacting transcriptional regulator, partial [Myxococcales bacterium]|nr:sigma 54-interacting transcriptional regulator [Myxococcales bacterium]